ncbi:MAG: hypothetical protein ACI89U_003387, partial [Gammaproteobacteria bacterium]
MFTTNTACYSASMVRVEMVDHTGRIFHDDKRSVAGL